MAVYFVEIESAILTLTCTNSQRLGRFHEPGTFGALSKERQSALFNYNIGRICYLWLHYAVLSTHAPDDVANFDPSMRENS